MFDRRNTSTDVKQTIDIISKYSKGKLTFLYWPNIFHQVLVMMSCN